MIHPARSLTALTLLWIAALLTPLGAQAHRADLSGIFLRDTPPLMAATPPPPGSAFFAIDTTAFDHADPIAITDARIGNFQLGADRSVTLLLRRFDVMAPAGITVIGRSSGDVPFALEKHLIFSGSVEGIAGSFVYLAIFRDFAAGYIDLPDADGTSRHYVIAPDNAAGPLRPTMIVSDTRKLPRSVRSHADCGIENMADYQAQVDEVFRAVDERYNLKTGGGDREQLASKTLVAQVAIECDTRFLGLRNNNLSQAASYALILAGTSSAIYQRDMNVMLQVPYLRLWTEIGPYVGPSSSALLNQVSQYWEENMRGVRRSVTMLLSKDVGGGVTWQNGSCGGAGYAVMGLDDYGVNFPASGYFWDVDVTSHELGHSFGSPHTHNCSWAPPIDTCFSPEGSCYSPAVYDRPGSIMSYCQATIAGSQLYFHPRVATLIRSNLETKPCIDPLDATSDDDIAVVQIIAPASGGTVAIGGTITPSAIVRNIGLRAQTAITVAFRVEMATAPGTSYNATATIGSLAPGESAIVTFTPFTATVAGTYLAKATADLPGDMKQLNNTMARPFQIAGPQPASSLALLSPNGGDIYQAGSPVMVRWSAAGTGDLTIQFSADDGLTWMPIRYMQPADSGSLRWIVPAIPTTKGRVRINCLNNSAVADISDTTFTIMVARDLQALEFVSPLANGSSESPVAPRVEFRNNGTEPLYNVPVRLRMIWRSNGAEVYNTTIPVGQIAPGATVTVNFPATSQLPVGEHVMIARALLNGDQAPSNDSVGCSVTFTGVATPMSPSVYPMSRSALLTWSPSPGGEVTGYRIYRGTSPDGLASVASVRSTVLSYADDDLDDGTEYFYAVRAFSQTKTSLASAIVSATPMTFRAGFALAAPELLLPRANAPDIPVGTSLLWSDVAGGEIYQVQIANDEGMTDMVSDRFTGKPVTTIPPDFGASYYWRVRAFNYSTTGPWSPVRRFSMQTSCAGGGLAFDGTANTWMDAPDFAWNTREVTVEFWNYVASGDVRNGTAFSVGGQQSGSRFDAFVPWDDRMLVWTYGDMYKTGRISASYAPYLDKWTHVALVSDGARFKAIYLDGRLVASDTVASHPPPVTWLYIGGSLTNYHKGMIDEFRIWDHVRTAEEIRHDMNRQIDAPQPGLRGYWRFDEGKGTTVADLSGGGATGRLSSDTLWRASGAPLHCANTSPLSAPDPIAPNDGQAFTVQFIPDFSWSAVPSADAYQLQLSTTPQFSSPARDIPNVAGTRWTVAGLYPGTTYFWRIRGQNGGETGPWSPVRSFTTAASCPATALAFDGRKSLLGIESFTFDGRAATVEFWNLVEQSQVQNGAAFSAGRAGDTTNLMRAHVPWSDGMLRWYYGATTTEGALATYYAPYLGAWTHVALVSDGIDSMHIYLNGELAALSGMASFPRGLSGLTVGAMPGRYYHNGMIDEFRVWNTPRTRQQIRADMYRRLPGPQSGLVGYWSMDEGSGSTARDSSGFAHDAMLIDGPMWRNATLPLVAPPEPISGPAIGLHGAISNIYSVTAAPGEHYSWNVIGGTIVAGGGTNTIDVMWGEKSDGIVALRTDRDAGCADSTDMHVAIMALAGAETGDAVIGLTFASAPNPFSASTTIRYTLPRRERIFLAIYSLDGALVARLADGMQDAGSHEAVFNGEGLPSGVYVCRIDAGSRYRYVKALHLVR